MSRQIGTEKLQIVSSRSSLELGRSVKLNSLETSHFPRQKKHHEVDGLSQLKANISQLEDLHYRLSFMMSEVQGLLKRS